MAAGVESNKVLLLASIGLFSHLGVLFHSWGLPGGKPAWQVKPTTVQLLGSVSLVYSMSESLFKGWLERVSEKQLQKRGLMTPK